MLDDATVTDVATRYGVDRQTLHHRLVRYAEASGASWGLRCNEYFLLARKRLASFRSAGRLPHRRRFDTDLAANGEGDCPRARPPTKGSGSHGTAVNISDTTDLLNIH